MEVAESNMQRPVPPSDWVAYVVVLGTVAAILLGKWMMFFNDKDMQESQTEQIDDTVEEILEETIEETLDEMIDEKIK